MQKTSKIQDIRNISPSEFRELLLVEKEKDIAELFEILLKMAKKVFNLMLYSRLVKTVASY